MPKHNGPDLQEDRGKPQYDYISFMDNFIEQDGMDEAAGPSQDMPKVGNGHANGYHN